MLIWRGRVSPPAKAPDGTMKHRLSKKVRGNTELSYLAEYRSNTVLGLWRAGNNGNNTKLLCLFQRQIALVITEGQRAEARPLGITWALEAGRAPTIFYASNPSSVIFQFRLKYTD